MKKDKGVIIFFAVMLSFISLIISFLYTIISEEESSPAPVPKSTKIPIGPIGPTGPTAPTDPTGPSPSNSPYTYYEEENPSWTLCTSDTNAMITHCTKSTNCGAIGRQSNGCWHMFKGDSLPAVSDTAFYAKYGTVLEKKNDFKLFYGGDDALGRDGRNACTMTDEDKEAACAADTKLQLIASGDSCGHKYYGTDKGMGSKLPTAYTNNYFCGTPAPIGSLFNSGDKISLKGGKDNKYCSDRPEGIICSVEHLNEWEKFTISKNLDNTYSLKGGKDNKYCSDRQEGMICNVDHLNQWEKFTISKNLDNTYSLKGGKDNKYCSDRPEGMICNVDHLNQWEKFTISKL
jgi:hypothetical protein